MKKLIFLFAIAAFIGCQEQRYTQSSPEIDVIKANIVSYESGDWDGYMSGFADTAKIYFNVDAEHETPQEVVDGFKETLAYFSSYGFVEDKGDIEMVVTDEGETWVNFWGLWEGTLADNGKTLQIPVHVTAQMMDGKVVKEHGYWDTQPLANAITEIEATKAAEAAEAETEDTAESADQ